MYKIPCVLMRAGTSKGVFFHKDDLPRDSSERDSLLLKILGSPSKHQIDGIGGGDPLTSKVAIISRSTAVDVDIDYFFAQISIDKPIVNTQVNCGNILSGVGPFAIDTGLIKVTEDKTTVRIRNVNTGMIVHATVMTDAGKTRYEGTTAIAGVPGTASPVYLDFKNCVGKVTGKLLPTGNPINRINKIYVSCVDSAMPVVFVNAKSFGKTGYESKIELETDIQFMNELENLRIEAAKLLHLNPRIIIPKIALVSPARDGGMICSRYFTPTTCHSTYPITGGICLSTACFIDESIANSISHISENKSLISIEHPEGKLDIHLEVTFSNQEMNVTKAEIVRTCRPLFSGYVYIKN